jgi:uncharacterized membrane protein YeaQ/YmgE (transglycosylase-associated protein family)
MEIMWFFAWFILGAVIGWLVSFLTKAVDRPRSAFAGFLGAVTGCFVSWALGYEAFAFFSLAAAIITQVIALVFAFIASIVKIGKKA